MSNIEEDIKILERFKNNEMQRDKLERDNRCGAWKIGDIYKHLELNTAINHILAEREADKKKIKELEEDNKRKDMFVEMAKEVIENSILKQKVKDLIKNETINISGFECIAVEDLKELLEEK